MAWQTQCCSMKDYQFLRWMRGRLIYQYGENADVDFVQRLGQIADEVERQYSLTDGGDK